VYLKINISIIKGVAMTKFTELSTEDYKRDNQHMEKEIEFHKNAIVELKQAIQFNNKWNKIAKEEIDVACYNI